MNQRKILVAVQKAQKAFRTFVSDKQSVARGPCGQTMGCESYRIEFTGNQEGAVHDALMELLKEVIKETE